LTLLILLSYKELAALEDLNTHRITRILTTDFPQYFAIVSRIRQEVHAIGPEGGIVSSSVVPQVQAVFPQGALTKRIKVGLQVNQLLPLSLRRRKGRGGGGDEDDAGQGVSAAPLAGGEDAENDEPLSENAGGGKGKAGVKGRQAKKRGAGESTGNKSWKRRLLFW
jgi:hypothetical protein